MKLRFAGFGGQGVVLCGFIYGKAAMLDGMNSVQTQSYGSASRGGLTKSDVGIESGEIYDLVNDKLDVLVTLSQQSYDKYHKDLMPDGKLFYESQLVQLEAGAEAQAYGIGVTDIAFQKFGRKIMANMVMIGFLHGVAGVVSKEALLQTIKESVPPKTIDKNFEAFAEGMRLAEEYSGKGV